MTEKQYPLNLAAVLVAAGPSTRLGRPKQLVKFQGETLVRRSANLLLEAMGGPVVVVSGFESEPIKREVADLPVDAVFNPEWEKGMGGSIACGARYVKGIPAGILVGVCDQWQLSANDLGKLISAWQAQPRRIHTAYWQEGRAHVSGPPVIFPGKLRGELKGLEKSRGARQIIDRHIDIVEFVELESAARDLDRPEDLELLES